MPTLIPFVTDSYTLTYLLDVVSNAFFKLLNLFNRVLFTVLSIGLDLGGLRKSDHSQKQQKAEGIRLCSPESQIVNES